MGTAYNTRGGPQPAGAGLDEEGVPTGELVEGDTVSTRIRNYPRDIVTVNLAAEYPITKKWIALLELTSSWEGGRLFGHKANVAAGGFGLGHAGDRVYGHRQILPGHGTEYRPGREKHRCHADADVFHGICFLRNR